MSERLVAGIADAEQIGEWLQDTLHRYEDELHERDGHDSHGEIAWCIGQVNIAITAVKRIVSKDETPHLAAEIAGWLAEQDRLSDMADARSL